MKEALENYSRAFSAHVEAQKFEMISKLDVRRTYYALLAARDAVKDKERELIDTIEQAR